MHSVGHATATVITLMIGLAFNVISKHIINHQITFIARVPHLLCEIDLERKSIKIPTDVKIKCTIFQLNDFKSI